MVHIWFLEIAFVHNIGMCVFPSLRLVITIHVKFAKLN